MPRLDDITTAGLRIEGGWAYPSDKPGLGIDWDWDAIAAMRRDDHTAIIQ